MADTASARPKSLQEEDFYLWTLTQAAALRAAGRKLGHSEGLDWDLLAEEIEDVGAAQRNECYSRVTTILEHLYKLAWSLRVEPVAGWKITILMQRRDLSRSLTKAIRNLLLQDLEKLHLDALATTRIEFSANKPSTPQDSALRWTMEQILGEENDPVT